jgi:hypothetical protein
MHPQRLNRFFLKLLLIVSVTIAIVITAVSYRHNEWATMASAMSVITAVLAIWASLNLTWRQEDEKQPQVNIYIDDMSHKHAYSLVIRNDGGGPAYKVRIDWTVPIYDYENKVPRFTDFEDEYDFEYLHNGSHYSRLIMGADSFRGLIENSDKPLIYEGTISYAIKSESSLRIKHPFKVSLEPLKKRVNVLNDQMDFYFENKKLTSHVKSIADSLQKLHKVIANNKNLDG